jgi:hypothetical protein
MTSETIEELIDKLIWAVHEEADDLENCHRVIREEIKPAKDALLARFEQLEIACHEKDDLVQAILTSLAALREENKALKEAARWIPVDIGTPRPAEDEVVWVYDDGIYPATWANGRWWETPFFSLDGVTHWMHKPQPPEPATDEEVEK